MSNNYNLKKLQEQLKTAQVQAIERKSDFMHKLVEQRQNARTSHEEKQNAPSYATRLLYNTMLEKLLND